MSKNKCLREPPKAAIEAGYNLVKARDNWPDESYYLAKAIEKTEEALAIVMDEAGALYMQASEGLYFMNEAAHAQIMINAGKSTDKYRKAMGKHAIGRAHNSLRLELKSLGYRDITNEDFEEFGAGGGR